MIPYDWKKDIKQPQWLLWFICLVVGEFVCFHEKISLTIKMIRYRFYRRKGGKEREKKALFPIGRNSRISTTCRSINTGLMKIIGTRSHFVRVAAIEDPFPFLCPPMLQLSRHCPHLDGTKLLFPCPISPGCITSVAQISICLFIGRWFFVTSPAVVLSVVPVPTDFYDK